MATLHAENKLALFGLLLIGILLVTAAFAPLIAPYDPTRTWPTPWHRRRASTGWAPIRWDATSCHASSTGRGSPSSSDSPRSCWRRSSASLGALAGWYGGGVDSVVMRVADVFFAFPLLIGAIVIILVLGRGVTPVVLSLAIFSWATVARLQRSSILTVRESDYVMAARALGAGGWRLVSRHVLPNSFAPVLVYATFSVGVAVVAEASLSFLGVGVKADVPEWEHDLGGSQLRRIERLPVAVPVAGGRADRARVRLRGRRPARRARPPAGIAVSGSSRKRAEPETRG